MLRERLMSSLKFNYNLNSVLIFVCVFSSYLVNKLYKLHTGKCSMTVTPKFDLTAKMVYFKDQRTS